MHLNGLEAVTGLQLKILLFSDNKVSFINKPPEIKDYIELLSKMKEEFSNFDGMRQAPQQISDTLSKFSKFDGMRQAPQQIKYTRGLLHLHP